MASAAALRPAALLQELMEELNIGSLDDSDVEAGLQEFRSEDFGGSSSSMFGTSLADDDGDGSSVSGISAQVRVALGGGGASDGAEGAVRALEAQLRLGGPAGAPSAALLLSRSLARASPPRQRAEPAAELLQSSLTALAQAQAAQGEQIARLKEKADKEAAASAAAVIAGRWRVGDLEISEARYKALLTKSEEELTNLEWTQLRFHEARSEKQAQIERLRMEVESLREANTTVQSRAERAERQLSQRAATVADLTKELDQLQKTSRSELERVTAELFRSEKSLVDLKEKGRMYDDLAAKAKRLEEELHDIREALSMQSAVQQQLAKEHSAATDRLQLLETAARTAKQDAESHERRARLLEDQLNRRDGEVAELKMKVESLREKKRELARKAALEQQSSAQEVRDQVNVEIRRFQEQARGELEQVRANLITLHEKEVQMFRERLEAATVRTNQLQQRLEDEEHAHQALQLSASRVRAELQNEITELTGALKLRSFEAERAGLVHEEVSLNRQRLEVENEQLRKQVEVLRHECLELELRHKESRAAERAELMALRESLQSYVELEKQMDLALQACAETAVSTSETTPQSLSEALLIGTTLASAPTSAQRRIQQSLILAQELQKRSRDLATVKAALAATEAEAAQLRDQLDMAAQEADAMMSSAPQAYLLEAVRAREAEIVQLRRELRETANDLHRSRELQEAAQAARLRTEEDLRQLLSQRQHLDGLRAMVLASDTPGRGGQELEGAVPRAEHRGRAPTQVPQSFREPTAPRAPSGPGGAGASWFHQLQEKVKRLPPSEGPDKQRPAPLALTEPRSQ